MRQIPPRIQRVENQLEEGNVETLPSHIENMKFYITFNKNKGHGGLIFRRNIMCLARKGKIKI